MNSTPNDIGDFPASDNVVLFTEYMHILIPILVEMNHNVDFPAVVAELDDFAIPDDEITALSLGLAERFHGLEDLLNETVSA